MGRVDIHAYPKLIAHAVANVEHSELSPEDKRLILAYRDACLLQGWCGDVRLIRVLGVLLLLGRTAGMSFRAMTRADVERVIRTWRARNPPYSAETIGTYKSITKRFLWWVHDRESFETRGTQPALVAWITTTVRRRDKRTLQRNELLTPADIERLLRATRDPRERALISILWETGSRISEAGNLLIESITPTEDGYLVDLNGKTGHRTVLIISSATAVRTWLAHHPDPRPGKPLWVPRTALTAEAHLSYQALRMLVLRIVRRAGITKRVYPHLFRHSRATYVLATGIMNEAQAKAYFGWTPDTHVLGTYAHLVTSDANEALRREHKRAADKDPMTELIAALSDPARAAQVREALRDLR